MTSASVRPEYQTDLLAKRTIVPWSIRLMSWASAIASSGDGKSIGMVIGCLSAMATLLGRVAVVRPRLGGDTPWRGRSGSCRNLFAQRHDIGHRRMNDTLDKSGQLLESVLLFVVVGVAVIHAAHAGNDMTKAALGNIRIYTCPAHQGACCSAKIMQNPTVRPG